MSPSPRFFTSVPPGLGDGLAQDREVPPADLVGGLGRQALRQLRRAHQVGEQDRRALGAQELPSRLENTRVGDGRNGLPRGARVALWGLRHAPPPGFKALATRTEMSARASLYIHLARCTTCRYIAPRTPVLETVGVGWPGGSQPPAPTDPGVTVSRHRALLTRRSVRTRGPTSTGRTGRAVVRSARPTTA